MRRTAWTMAAILMIGSPTLAQDTQRGAAVGGVTGAIAGALIGDHNGESGAGALIGGAVGAGVGAILGNAKAKEKAQQRYYTQQQQAYATQQTMLGAVSSADVVSMSRSGLGDNLIINQIQQRGVQRRLEVPDIIYLHNSGVHEHVITAMQNASIGAPAPVAPVVVAQPQPVVVERYYEPAPVYYVPPRPRVHVIYGAHYHHHHW